MSEILSIAYPWIKAFHIMSVIAWMAGLFYLPRLFVYHAEKVGQDGETHALFSTMERKLYGVIMTPAMMATWVFGLLLVTVPGVVSFDQPWVWLKFLGIVAMTVFHVWCKRRLVEFSEGRNTRQGKKYRMMNEVPTLLMVLIVVSVIVRPFS